MEQAQSGNTKFSRMCGPHQAEEAAPKSPKNNIYRSSRGLASRGKQAGVARLGSSLTPCLQADPGQTPPWQAQVAASSRKVRPSRTTDLPSWGWRQEQPRETQGGFGLCSRSQPSLRLLSLAQSSAHQVMPSPWAHKRAWHAGAHLFNPSTRETETRGALWVQD